MTCENCGGEIVLVRHALLGAVLYTPPELVYIRLCLDCGPDSLTAYWRR